MFYYMQIYVSEGININKTNHLFECKIDHYRYSFKIQFTCQIDICECWYNMLEKAMNFREVAILLVQRNRYRIYFSELSKDDAIDMIKKLDLDVKSKSIWKAINCSYKISSNINTKKQRFNYLNDPTNVYILHNEVLSFQPENNNINKKYIMQRKNNG